MTESRGNQVKKIRLEELLPVIQEKLESGGKVTIPVTGTSMNPTLVSGRDSVTLTRLEGSPKRLDLPLYRRKNGQFVLHRIVSLEPDGSFSCCGDHQWVREPGLRPEQIVGMVCEIQRQGRSVSVQAPGHRLWVRFWAALLPCRRLLFRLAHGPAWLRKKLGRKS